MPAVPHPAAPSPSLTELLPPCLTTGVLALGTVPARLAVILASVYAVLVLIVLVNLVRGVRSASVDAFVVCIMHSAFAL